MVSSPIQPSTGMDLDFFSYGLRFLIPRYPLKFAMFSMCFACAYMLCVHYSYAPDHFIRFSLEILDLMYLIYTSHRMR